MTEMAVTLASEAEDLLKDKDFTMPDVYLCVKRTENWQAGKNGSQLKNFPDPNKWSISTPL